MKSAAEYDRELWYIWHDAVDGVNANHVTNCKIKPQENSYKIIICDREYSLNNNSRIIVIGAGKACAQMATGVEEALYKTKWFHKLSGWVNVPANTIELKISDEFGLMSTKGLKYSAVDSNYYLEKITLHPAREGGSNYPTVEGVAGTSKMLKLLETMSDDDLAIILISGGGSALMPAPIPEITLEQKLWITRHLSQRGATIQELNTVRICLSEVKGGKLLNHIKYGQAVCLVISDIIGDPIDLIASGPTVSSSTTPLDALEILKKYPHDHPYYYLIFELIQNQLAEYKSTQLNHKNKLVRCDNYIIANYQTALECGCFKGEYYYNYQIIDCQRIPFSGDARSHAKDVADKLLSARKQIKSGTDYLYLAGGETTVDLSNTPNPGKGGRNQEVVLAVLCEFWESGMEGIYFLSGGTDGEDGPTDAAGAKINHAIWKKAKELNLDPHDYLARHDAYHFFKQLNALIITGPTHTNVMDIEVGIVTVK